MVFEFKARPNYIVSSMLPWASVRNSVSENPQTKKHMVPVCLHVDFCRRVCVFIHMHVCFCVHVCACMRESKQIRDGISFPRQVGGRGATEIKNRGPKCGESGEGWKKRLLGDWLPGNVQGPSEEKIVE